MAKPRSSKIGRPTIISQDIIDKIANAVRAGNYIETAAAYAGISKDSLYKWLKKGAKSRNSPNPLSEDELYRSFSYAMEKALADSEAHDVAVIAQAARGGAIIGRKTITKHTVGDDGRPIETTTTEEDLAAPVWQAAAWRLERKFPEKWGRRERIEHTTPSDEPLVVRVKYGTERTPKNP